LVGLSVLLHIVGARLERRSIILRQQTGRLYCYEPMFSNVIRALDCALLLYLGWQFFNVANTSEVPQLGKGIGSTFSCNYVLVILLCLNLFMSVLSWLPSLRAWKTLPLSSRRLLVLLITMTFVCTCVPFLYVTFIWVWFGINWPLFPALSWVVYSFGAALIWISAVLSSNSNRMWPIVLFLPLLFLHWGNLDLNEHPFVLLDARIYLATGILLSGIGITVLKRIFKHCDPRIVEETDKYFNAKSK
jgi:hypothetical protein